MIVNAEIRRKAQRMSSILGITTNAFNVKAITDLRELNDHVFTILHEHPKVFRDFLLKIFDLRIKNVLETHFNITNFQNNDSIENTFPKAELKRILRVLENETGLVFPKPVFSNKSFIFQIAILVIPAIVVIGFLVFGLEFLIVMYGLVKFGFVLLAMVLPYLIVYFIFPGLFQPDRLYKIKLYQDLIQDVVWTNQFVFIDHDYKLTKQELEKFLDSL